MSFDDSINDPSDGPPTPPPTVADTHKALLELALDPKHSAQVGALARELLAELDPQDPAERMLAAQMIATFCRSMFLARCANRQKNPKWFALYSAECDRAMTLYRRQMQALDEHRRPRRATFTAIRTANIAGQQVVVTTSPPPDFPESPHPDLPHGEPRSPNVQAQSALPPLPAGKGRPPRLDPPSPTLDP